MLLRTAGDIGPLLREARRNQDLSQQQLAQAVGVSRAWVSMVENGKTSVEFDLVVSAFHALGHSISIESAEVRAGDPRKSRSVLTRQGQPLRSRRVSPSRGSE